ncbi:MAG: THUMP domain-containing protein [Methanophagales archaeon]|nr:THUMP domain-containing protein [Methanophagales archaeon]
MVEDWNVLVIGERDAERELLEELEEDGEFERSGFRDVVIGRVEDIVEFLEDAEQKKYSHLNRVIPIDDAFYVSPENLVEILKKRVERYIDEIELGETFGFRVERRGMKEDISSQMVEREVGGYFFDLLEKVHGRKPKVDLKNPDKLIAVELIGNRCGIGFITREMREKYSVIQVK